MSIINGTQPPFKPITREEMYLAAMVGAGGGGSSVLAEIFKKTTTGNPAHIEGIVAQPAKALVANIEPVQAGSGDPSPDNVRPISGWTKTSVTRAGKNLLDLSLFPNTWTAAGVTYTTEPSTGSILFTRNSSSTANLYYVSSERFLLKAGVYTLSAIFNTTAENVRFGLYVDGAVLSSSVITAGTPSQTVTIPADTEAGIHMFYSRDLSETLKISGIMLRYATEANDPFEPYQGETYSVTFPAEAGTVYGGTLDVTTGLLTVTRGNIASYNGENLPGAWLSSMDVYRDGATPTNGAQVVYELPTPVTYQLTPTEARLLAGTNSVWADTGDVTVSYLAK